MLFFRLGAVVCLFVTGAWAAVSPDELFRAGEKAEKAGDFARAYSLYSEAAMANPMNVKFFTKANSLRPLVNLLEPGNLQVGESGLGRLRDEHPELVDTASSKDLEDSRQPLPPAELSAQPGTKDLDLRGDSKAIIEQTAKAFGLNVVFDGAYQVTPNLHLQLVGANYHVALHAAEAATGAFFVPVSDRLLFAANDNQQKRTEFDRAASLLIPIPEPFSVQDVQEIVTAVRGLLEITRLFVDTQRRVMVLRDRASKLRIAQAVVADLMRSRSEVGIDVQVIVTDQSSSLHYGLALPTATSVVSLGQFASNLIQTIPAGYSNFLSFGGGKSLLGLGIANASLFGILTKSQATTLLESQLVSVDGQPVNFHVGEKYPIATNIYIGQTSGSATVYTPPPTFSFEDLGLLLKITPHVQGLEDIALDVSAEFKLLGATSIDGIPVVEARKFESKVQLREGQWAVLAGLVSGSEMRSVTGIPGLTRIPMLHDDRRSKDRNETLIVLKPHLLSMPPSSLPTRPMWIGTDTRPIGL